MADTWVNRVGGVPVLADFLSTGGRGSPICIDLTTDQAYYLADGDVVTALAGGGSGGGAAWGGITGTLSDQTDLQAALDGKQSTLPKGTAVVTVPAKRIEWEQTIAAVGVTGSMVILPSLAPALDSDENCPEMLSVEGLSGLAGTDQITFSIAFREPTTGPIKLNWSAF